MSVNLEDLRISIAGRSIVKGISMRVGDGERVGLIGASGSGKSMIAKACLGLLPSVADVRGSIRIGQQEIVGADERNLSGIRGSATGLVVQNPAAALNPVKRVFDQVALPLTLHYQLDREQIRTRVIDMLRRVGLTETIADKFPHQLSGGQQQRVAIATALVTSPKFIIADGPSRSSMFWCPWWMIRGLRCCSSPMTSRCSPAPPPAVRCWTRACWWRRVPHMICSGSPSIPSRGFWSTPQPS